MNFYLMFICVIFLLWNSFGETLFTKRVTFDDINGLIAAFNDFNIDRTTDMFLITDRGRAVELARGYESEPYLRKWPDIKCQFANTSGERIVGVITADFTGNTFVDLLIVTQNIFATKSKFKAKKFKLWFALGNRRELECNTTVPLAEDITSLPLVLDFNGDMITDFIVQRDNCSKELWVNFRPTCLQSFHTNQSMNYPNSNAFIDLSRPKDFSPDIYISGTEYIEYWFNKRGFRAQNNLTINYPNKKIYKFWGQSTFVDINFNGVIDHIIPVCRSDINKCKEPQILGLFFNKTGYEWIELLDLSDQSFVEQTNLTFTQTKAFNYLDFFVTLRAGDMNSDGYPDFVTVMREQNSTKTRAVYLESRYTHSNKFRRKYVIRWTSDDILLSDRTGGQNSIHMASIFDFDEDGKLDIVIGSHDSNNTIYLDAYIQSQRTWSSNFLKVMVSSGICYSDCPHINSPLIGPYLCFSPSGGDTVSCAGQMSQTAHFALQAPFVLFGLGETPNFVENLTISIPSGRMKIRYQTWDDLIPDSRIIMIPYPANNTDDWVQKLYLDPKLFAFPVLITLTTICCLLLIIIAFLHKRDLIQDIYEHKEYKKHWL